MTIILLKRSYHNSSYAQGGHGWESGGVAFPRPLNVAGLVARLQTWPCHLCATHVRKEGAERSGLDLSELPEVSLP